MVRKCQAKKTDLVRYSSKPLLTTEIEETWTPEPKLDELYLQSLPPRDEKDDKIEALEIEIEAQKLMNSSLN